MYLNYVYNNIFKREIHKNKLLIKKNILFL